MNPILRLFTYLRPYGRSVLLATLSLVLVTATDLAFPSLLQHLVDYGINPKDMVVIMDTTIMMIGTSLLGGALSIWNDMLSIKTAQNFAADIRGKVFHKVQRFSFGNLDQFQTGQLIVRLTSDVNMVQMTVMMSLRMLISAPLMIAGSITLMVLISQTLAAMMALPLLLMMVVMVFFVYKGQPMFLHVQKRLDRLNQVLQENLAGVRVVKAFTRTGYEEERFDDANVDFMRQATKVNQLLSVLMPLMTVVVSIAITLVIWFGGQWAIEGNFTLGDMLAFVNYLMSTLFPVMMLAMMAGQLSAASASAERIVQVLDIEPQVQERPDAKPLADVSGRVAFEGVCFGYGGSGTELVLKDIDLVAEPGQTVAILGATGSGKSSLIDLIPRFYDVTKGRVTIDGVDVRDITLESLRSKIGIALQETVLFSGTIRDNIRYGRPSASDGEVVAAARSAEAHEFITSFPKGYDTQLGERGVNLSGGQKQRIAIARALLIQPRILILDDSTSSVDIETEVKIQDSLKGVMAGRTTFVIAQRISTVLNADKIVVLERGQIVAQGTHSELMTTSPIYREIYESQLGGGGTTP